MADVDPYGSQVRRESAGHEIREHQQAKPIDRVSAQIDRRAQRQAARWHIFAKRLEAGVSHLAVGDPQRTAQLIAQSQRLPEVGEVQPVPALILQVEALRHAAKHDSAHGAIQLADELAVGGHCKLLRLDQLGKGVGVEWGAASLCREKLWEHLGVGQRMCRPLVAAPWQAPRGQVRAAAASFGQQALLCGNKFGKRCCISRSG